MSTGAGAVAPNFADKQEGLQETVNQINIETVVGKIPLGEEKTRGRHERLGKVRAHYPQLLHYSATIIPINWVRYFVAEANTLHRNVDHQLCCRLTLPPASFWQVS